MERGRWEGWNFQLGSSAPGRRRRNEHAMMSARAGYPPVTVLIYPVGTQIDLNLKHAAVPIQTAQTAPPLRRVYSSRVQSTFVYWSYRVFSFYCTHLCRQVHCTMRRYKTRWAILLIQWWPLDRKTCWLSSRVSSHNGQRPACDIRRPLKGPQYLARTKRNGETSNAIEERNNYGFSAYKER